MGLLSFLKRQSDPPAEASPTHAPDAVAAARAQARRRLIGATVLLAAGIIGFPLLFETQPRPVAADVPFELPGKDANTAPAKSAARPLQPAPGVVVADAAPDPVPAANPAPTSTAPLPATAAAPTPPAAPAQPVEITERAGDQGRELAPAAPVAAARPAPARPTAADTAHAVDPAKPAASHAVAATPPAAAASGVGARVVVQVGAFTEPDKLRDARQKVEKLGFKTYTQVIASDAGPRTRVRIGPFDSRADADKAAARVKAAGLPAAILTL